jgi:HlyD family secretion protein
MPNIFKRIADFVFSHKIFSIGLVLVIIFGAWFAVGLFSPKASVKYVVSAAAKGTLITSISGTGQVSSSNEVAINSKVSGEVTYVGVASGQDVSENKLLLKIDSTDAAQSVRDAQASYDLAKLSLEELKAPADELALMQAEDAVTAAEQAKVTAETSQENAYTNGFTSVSNAFLDLPTVVTGLNNLLFGNTYSSNQTNLDFYTGIAKNYSDRAQIYHDDAYSKYQTAKAAYDQNFSDYKNSTRNISPEDLKKLINETYETAGLISDAVKSANDLIQFYEDQLANKSLKPSTTADSHLSTLNDYTGKVNSILSNLLSIKQSIQSAENTFNGSERTIQEKQISLDKLKSGATDIEIKSEELAVQQKYNALVSAQKSLSDYYITAPFDGTVAKLSVSQGSSVSNGTALATFIAKGKLVSISLNEVDISKVALGNPVTLTFDALPDLTLAGKVSQIDTVGTVSSGVVNYNVEISFDDAEGQVKPGMSASASIITEAKTDVLMVPNSAVKSSGESYYVEVPEKSVDSSSLNNNKGVSLSGTIQKKTVEIGASNDSYTEITSGLSENDQIISSTVTAIAKKTSTSSSSGSSSSSSNKSTNQFMMQGVGGPPN